MTYTQPKPLKKGDTVAIVSTARKINKDDLTPAINLLKQWGLNVIIGASIGKSDHQFSGTDQDRINDFQNMLNNNDVKAIWCARGGYGTVRIIDYLDFSHFVKTPKWIIGFSDVTVLHSHIHNLGVSSLHAVMPITIEGNTHEAVKSLQSTLFGNTVTYMLPNESLNRNGFGEGIIVGGNLSILYSVMGSVSAINTQGKILFIEDLDEYLYHIDRMMLNLKRNGYFNNLKGLIVGGMTKMHDNTIPFGKNAKEIILDAVSNYDFPVCFNFPAGHIDDNRALYFGQHVKLKVDDTETTLSFK